MTLPVGTRLIEATRRQITRQAHELLERIIQEDEPLQSELGWILAGTWETAMAVDFEVILLWAIPTWEQWAAAEKAERSDTKPARW